jgi:hypothetical protein
VVTGSSLSPDEICVCVTVHGLNSPHVGPYPYTIFILFISQASESRNKWKIWGICVANDNTKGKKASRAPRRWAELVQWLKW